MIVPYSHGREAAVDVKFMPEEHTFTLVARDQNGQIVPGERLRYWLYAHDRRSFYGTRPPGGCKTEPHGLTLDALEALRLLSRMPLNSAVAWQWNPSLTELESTAQHVERCLVQGEWTPDVNSLRRGGFGLAPASPAMLPYAAEWLTAAVKELARQESSLRTELRAFDELAVTLSATPGASQWGEKMWHIRLGLTQDRRPYRWGLSLSEPRQGDYWLIQAVLVHPQTLETLASYNADGDQWEWHSPLTEADHAVREWPGERAAIEALVPGLFENGGRLSFEAAWTFLDQEAKRLSQAGYRLLLPAWWEDLVRIRPQLRARVKTPASTTSLLGLDAILKFDWELAIGGVALSRAEFERLAKEKRGLMRVHDQWVLWDPAWLSHVRKVMSRLSKNAGISFGEVLEKAFWEGDLSRAEEDRPDSPSVDDFAVSIEGPLGQWIRQLEQRESIPDVPQPAGFRGSLRPYQQRGVAWLWFLRRFGLGAILADDMGLGKTVQYIAYLLMRQQSGAATAPHLLIVPTSVLGNWHRELAQFGPELRVHVHYGPDRTRGDAFLNETREADVVMTTYALALADAELLTSIRWESVCLDEAQQIKNAYSKRAAALRKLEASHRIALTGTPIENRLADLWSIMSFVNPGYLGSMATFNRRFAVPIEKSNDTARKEALRRLITPFMLRRTKHDPGLALDLPEKSEIKEFVSLSTEQAALYEAVVERMLETIDKVEPMQRRGLIIATLTRLKQICDHPDLVAAAPESLRHRGARSAKLVRLTEMVEELRSEKDQCLVFTQFVRAGELIQAHLGSQLGEPVGFLHGSLGQKQREALIAAFQAEKSPLGILILSLKAGGVGLNLTQASYVFHFDRWWNPAVENQATDRTHRIGQTQRVQVHKFISLGTVEERIDAMLEQKQALSDDIIGTGEEWITELSTPDLRDLLMLRRQWLTE